MKAVIFAGGFGTRLSEATNLIPKPMVEIGGKPILWHIMKTYSHYGINEFVICCGYKQYEFERSENHLYFLLDNVCHISNVFHSYDAFHVKFNIELIFYCGNEGDVH